MLNYLTMSVATNRCRSRATKVKRVDLLPDSPIHSSVKRLESIEQRILALLREGANVRGATLNIHIPLNSLGEKVSLPVDDKVDVSIEEDTKPLKNAIKLEKPTTDGKDEFYILVHDYPEKKFKFNSVHAVTRYDLSKLKFVTHALGYWKHHLTYILSFAYAYIRGATILIPRSVPKSLEELIQSEESSNFLTKKERKKVDFKHFFGPKKLLCWVEESECRRQYKYGERTEVREVFKDFLELIGLELTDDYSKADVMFKDLNICSLPRKCNESGKLVMPVKFLYRRILHNKPFDMEKAIQDQPSQQSIEQD